MDKDKSHVVHLIVKTFNKNDKTRAENLYKKNISDKDSNKSLENIAQKEIINEEEDYKRKSTDIYDSIVNEIDNGGNISSIEYSDKKKPLIELALDSKRNSMQYKEDKELLEKLSKIDTERTELLGKLLEKDFTNKLYSVKFGLPDNEKCTLNIVKRHMQITEYIHGNSIKIVTDMLPANFISQQSGRNFSTNKIIIMQYLSETLKDIHEQWDKVIIKYHVKFPFICDLDNYYFKVYTDGIVLGGLIKDDNYTHVTLMFTGEYSIEPQLEIEIKNADFIE